MKATELRIGNYVYMRDGIGTLSMITDDSPNGKPKVRVKFKEWIFARSIKECKPIPLTEQWLKDLRFDIDDYGAVDEDETCQVKLMNKFAIVFKKHVTEEEDEEWVPLRYINHVHELQNLYFALTGKELLKQENNQNMSELFLKDVEPKVTTVTKAESAEKIERSIAAQKKIIERKIINSDKLKRPMKI